MNRRTIPTLRPWADMRADFAWTLPHPFNIADACCDAWARDDPGRPAIIDLNADRRVWNYGDLKRASDALAAYLSQQGIGPGDRVAILLPQRAEVMVAHFAAMKLGAISLPLTVLFGSDALSYRLGDAGASAIVSDKAGLARVAALDLPDLRVMVDADHLPDGGDVVPVTTGPDDPAMMIYTSGTTGGAKGVLHAHRFLIGHLPCAELAFDGMPQPGDVGWTPADWAWIGGLMDIAMPCLFHGVPLVAQRFMKFDECAAWDLMRDEAVTIAFMPPTALRMLRRTQVPDGLSLRAVMSGGEALGVDLTDWGRDVLGVPFNEIYGQTECNLVLASCAGTQDMVPGTLGRAVPGCDVQVQGDDGAPVATGDVGEICTRGSVATFLRYWNRPEQTAAKWRNGWLRTGDLGVALPDGVVCYHARDDDVINSAGYRIGPTEIETCLTAHPSVILAAVVGLPDPVRGQAVTAFVVADGATDALAADLTDWVRTRLSPHMAPRRIVFRDTLPMTPTGKIQRRILREQATEGSRPT